MAMRKALNNDPHTSSLASGNLSTDNNLKRKVDEVVGEIEKLPLPQHFPQYGRSTAFQSPPDNPIYTDRQNDISGLSKNMNNYNCNYFQSPNDWNNNMNNNNNTNKHSSKYSILNLG